MDIGEVVLNQSGFNTTRIAGEINFTLACSAYIRTLPENVSLPKFEWFFGPDNSSFPIGFIVSNVTNSSNTYTSTLKFSALSESHSGLYTCRLGGNERLAANTNISVKGRLSNKICLRSSLVPVAGPISSFQCCTLKWYIEKIREPAWGWGYRSIHFLCSLSSHHCQHHWKRHSFTQTKWL